jgi:hypothetical protein
MITHLSSALTNIADTSIMIGEEIGGVGIVVEGQWVDNVATGF